MQNKISKILLIRNGRKKYLNSKYQDIKNEKEENKLNEKHTVRPRRRRGSSTCEKLGTLAVLRISG